LPLGRAGFEQQPLTPEAKAALEALTLGKHVRLSFGGLQTDRYGRALAHLHVDGDLWVQGEMVRLGLARVYSFQDNRTMVRDLLEIKIQARTPKRGIWALAFYGIR
jgi:endonuclease YncB( thermonuclease family)